MDIAPELKKHYPDLYPELEKIFNKYDPLGFEPGVSTPANEYDLEILELIPHLDTKKDQKSILSLLIDIFIDKFGEENIRNREKQQLKKISVDISEWIK